MNAKAYIVYVIDDDESVRKAFARLLRSANFRAETFSSVDEFLRDPKETGEACILTDIRMPDESGFDSPDKTGCIRDNLAGHCGVRQRRRSLSVNAYGNWGLRHFSENRLMTRPFWMPSGGPSPRRGDNERHVIIRQFWK